METQTEERRAQCLLMSHGKIHKLDVRKSSSELMLTPFSIWRLAPSMFGFVRRTSTRHYFRHIMVLLSGFAMLFGLCNALTTFHQMMNDIKCTCYTSSLPCTSTTFVSTVAPWKSNLSTCVLCFSILTRMVRSCVWRNASLVFKSWITSATLCRMSRFLCLDQES
jgi:hypothetical protein